MDSQHSWDPTYGMSPEVFTLQPSMFPPGTFFFTIRPYPTIPVKGLWEVCIRNNDFEKATLPTVFVPDGPRRGLLHLRYWVLCLTLIGKAPTGGIRRLPDPILDKLIPHWREYMNLTLPLPDAPSGFANYWEEWCRSQRVYYAQCNIPFPVPGIPAGISTSASTKQSLPGSAAQPVGGFAIGGSTPNVLPGRPAMPTGVYAQGGPVRLPNPSVASNNGMSPFTARQLANTGAPSATPRQASSESTEITNQLRFIASALKDIRGDFAELIRIQNTLMEYTRPKFSVHPQSLESDSNAENDGGDPETGRRVRPRSNGEGKEGDI